MFKDKGVAHVCAMFPINNIFFPLLVLGFGKKNGEVREKSERAWLYYTLCVQVVFHIVLFSLMLSSVQEIKCMRINMLQSIDEAIKYNWRERTPIIHKLYRHLIPYVDGIFTFLDWSLTQNKN